MKLQSVAIATLVAAAFALPAPKHTDSDMKRQLGLGDSKKGGAPWKRAGVSHVYA